MLLSIVFSFRNEENNIPELVKRLDTALKDVDDLRYEAIFVNDDSTDNSVKILRKLKEEYPVIIVNTSRKFGVTPCVLAGFSVARGDAVVYMDSDLQDPPELIPLLIEKYREGADVVHTTRTERDGESKIKLWATRLAYKIINKFSDIPLPENTGDFKLISRKALSQILELNEYDPYMRGLAVWVGFKQEYVYYRRDARWAGETKFPLFSKGPVKEFLRGLTAYSAAPLYLSLALGLIVCALCLALIAVSILTKLLGYAVPGVSGIIILIAFLGGIGFLCNGILGIYVAKIYYEVKARPRVIVSSIERDDK